MSDTKISALPDGGALQAGDALVVARSTSNVKVLGSAVETPVGAQAKADAAQAVAATTAQAKADAAQAAAQAASVPLTQRGAANGVATLGADGLVPAVQLGVVQNYDPRLTWLGRIINRTLVAAGESFSIAIKSDSTANDITDWFYLLGSNIAARHPAYTVRWYPWVDAGGVSALGAYGPPIVIQTGTAGERYLTFAGSGFNWQLPSSVAPTAPADLDVSVRVALDDWTPAVSNVLCARSESAGSRSWWLDVQTNGKLELNWSPDGTALVTVQSSVAPTVVDGSPLWVRVQLDVDDGAGHYTVKFYTSNDGATWTQLGTTTTGAATTALFNATGAAYSIGGRSSGTTMSGKFYEVRILAGLDGGTILPCFPEHWTPFSSGSNNISGPTGAPVLAILGGAQSGQGLSYLSDAVRLPKLLPGYGVRAVFLSTMHNDGNTIASGPGYDGSWLALYSAWVTAVKARVTEGVPVIVTENPETVGTSSSAQGRRAHALRRDKLLALASQLGVPSLDGWQAFVDGGGNVQTSYLNADGIHPTATGPGDGMHLWASYADAALGQP